MLNVSFVFVGYENGRPYWESTQYGMKIVWTGVFWTILYWPYDGTPINYTDTDIPLTGWELIDNTSLTATFSVNVSVTPAAAATYQWQKQEAGTSIWSNIVVATSASYTTGALTAVDDNGDKYRVQISAPDTRAIVSAVATLEVTTSGTQSVIDLMLESGVEDLMLGSGVLDLQLDN
jgi:hypothetical protein